MKHLFLSFIILASINILFCDGTEPTGAGSLESPYQIASLDNLLWLSTNASYWGDHYVQTGDIDATETQNWFDGAGFSPIGTESDPFSGDFNGQGNVISNLTINRPSLGGCGLFGYTDGANLQNIHLTDVLISGESKTGSLVGFNQNTTLYRCSATGTLTVDHQSVNSNSYAGGLAGRHTSFDGVTANIIECFADVDITANGDCVGGITGLVLSGFQSTIGGDILISNCYSQGSITAENCVGGLAGKVPGGANTPGTILIEDCYAAVEITGLTSLGGLIADRGIGSVDSSFWDTDVSGQTSSDGGTGLTTTEMQDYDTYDDAGWQFMDEWYGDEFIWGINPNDNQGYPFLAYQGYINNLGVYPPGYGTSSNPWEISTIQHLLWISTHVSACSGNNYFIQTANIDATDTQNWNGGEGFPPIGDFSQGFRGTYDGAGYTITNLHMNRPNSYCGLFYKAIQSTLQNIHLVDFSYTCYGQSGGLVAIATEPNISMCSATGNINASHGMVGGLVGNYSVSVRGATIEQCWVNVNIDAEGEKIGGLIGQMVLNDNSEQPMVISNCYTRGSVAGESLVAGLVGSFYNYGQNRSTFSNCYSTCAVSGTSDVGGLFSTPGDVTVENCFWDTYFSGQSYSWAGTGMAIADMRHAQYFYQAGWDFAGETQNGSDDIWGINNDENNGYPFLIWQGFANTDYCALNGSGTDIEPYQVSNFEQLRTISELLSLWGNHYIQTNNINTPETYSQAFIPIGSQYHPFIGSYNGDGYMITDLEIDRTANYNGLFGYTKNSTFANIHLVDIHIQAYNYTGSLIGCGDNIDVTNCSATGGTCVAGSYSGGLIGWISDTGSSGSSVSNCWTNMYISSALNCCLGGLIGVVFSSNNTEPTIMSITNCYTCGTVYGYTYMGGLVGYIRGNNNQSFSIENCFSCGHLYASSYAGGLVGFKNNCAVNNCFWDVESSGVTTSQGGTGLSTIEMKMPGRYVSAGWDFADESENGLDDYWGINQSVNGGYPFLMWQGYENLDFFILPGNGTSDDPYQIDSLDALLYVSRLPFLWDCHFIQTSDIDATETQNWNDGAGFSPLGNDTTPFTGAFNGQGYTIEGLHIDRSNTDNIGLFGYCENAWISDVHLEDVDVSGDCYTGSLIGFIEDGRVEKCSATGSVAGHTLTGGLVGGCQLDYYRNGYLYIEKCWTNVQVQSTNSCSGGLIGSIHVVTADGVFGRVYVYDSYSRGEVHGQSNVGGLIGYTRRYNSYSTGIAIRKSYSIGLVDGTSNVGGFIGSNSNGSVYDCFWDKNTSGLSYSDGGIGLTTEEMQDYLTFFNAGWDFMDEEENGTDDVWGINPDENDGYPFLAWQGFGNIPPLSGAPQDVVLTTDSTSVTISWSPVEGATSYRIFSCATPDGEFLEDTSGNFENESWTAIMPRGGRYYYVKAVLDIERREAILQHQDSGARKR